MNHIDHDPNEPPIDRTPGPWKMALVTFSILAAGTVYSFGLDWISAALGFMAGGGIMAWVIEATGNKVPDSWRSKPPNSSRH